MKKIINTAPMAVITTLHTPWSVLLTLKPLGNGTYTQAQSYVSGSTEATRLAIRTAHREMASFAAKALDLPVTERNFSGVTLGVSEGSYAQIVRELDECRRRIIAIATADKSINQVYRVNLQMFPLTRKIEENTHEKV